VVKKVGVGRFTDTMYTVLASIEAGWKLASASRRSPSPFVNGSVAKQRAACRPQPGVMRPVSSRIPSRSGTDSKLWQVDRTMIFFPNRKLHGPETTALLNRVAQTPLGVERLIREHGQLPS